MRRAGEELGGYLLLRSLGSGGMGTVYEALDADRRHVALKLLHPHIGADPAARERLRREVATLHRVRHTGVARVLDAEADSDEAFVVTELVEGRTLDAAVRADGPFEGERLADLARGLAAALRAIHAAGVVHRDVKPANVMLTADGPVLIDFGISQILEDVERVTQTGMVTGTPGYLDPEVVAGGLPSAEGDWWSWAAVIDFAATGRPPFGRGSMEAVLGRVAAGEADVAGLPEPVARALLAALAPRIGDRLAPETVLAVLDGDPAVVRTVPRPGPQQGFRPGPRPPGPASTPSPRLPPIPLPATARAASAAASDGPPAPHGPPLPPGPAAPTRLAAAGVPAMRTAAPRAAQAVRPPSIPPVQGPVGPWVTGPVTASVPPGPQGPASAPGPPTGAVAPPPPAPPSAGSPPAPIAWPGPAPAASAERPGWTPGPAPRQRTTLLGLLLVAMGLGALWPGIVALVAVGLMVVAASVGSAVTATRMRRSRSGVRRSDIPLAWATSPWHLLRGALAVLVSLIVGLIAGAGVGATGWLLATGGSGALSGLPGSVHAAVLATALGAGLLVAWLVPVGGVLHLGAREVLHRIGPGEGSGALSIGLGIGALLLAAVVLLVGGVGPDLTPFARVG